MVINGIKIKGNCSNVVMVNGQIISGDKKLEKSQKFDEKKSLNADDVEQISIYTDSADIIVTTSDTNSIEAQFNGEAIVQKNPKLNITRKGKEAIVTLNIDSSVIGSLTLTVNIPMRKFETLNVSNQNGDVTAKNGVMAKIIRLDTHNGNSESEANFSVISATSHNGNVDVYVDAKTDVQIEASSHNGDVTVELQNIAYCNITTSTRNGSEKNRFRGRDGGYTAYGRVKSHNGDVTIR